VGLKGTNIKIGKTVTLYQREFFKQTAHLGTSCTQSVKEGLIGVKLQILHSPLNLLMTRLISERKHFIIMDEKIVFF
jgi:hypothetical protein